MNLKDAKELAIEKMNEHRLIVNGWVFKFDSRLSRLGSCSYHRKIITLSKPWTEMAEVETVLDTILHEIAHALTPKHHHDKVWKAKAIEIGCNGQRCHTGEKLPGKYKATCINGHTFYRHRMTSSKSSCPNCDKKYNPKFELIFKKNC